MQCELTIPLLRTVIVARDGATAAGLEELCKPSAGVRVVASAISCERARREVDRHRAEVLLVAGASPDLSGIDCLNVWPLQYAERAIVLINSWADAVSALSRGANEVLRAPLCADQLLLSALRLRARCARGNGDAKLRKRLHAERLSRPEARGMLLVGERTGKLYPLEPFDIDYIEAAGGNYVLFHVDAGEYIARDSIKRLTAVLEPFGFVRIEKSLLLNIRAVAYAECAGLGLFEFTLVSGAQLRCGPTYRESILDVLPLRRRAPRTHAPGEP
jgi:two-component system LytT family response regulator